MVVCASCMFPVIYECTELSGLYYAQAPPKPEPQIYSLHTTLALVWATGRSTRQQRHVRKRHRDQASQRMVGDRIIGQSTQVRHECDADNGSRDFSARLGPRICFDSLVHDKILRFSRTCAIICCWLNAHQLQHACLWNLFLEWLKPC